MTKNKQTKVKRLTHNNVQVDFYIAPTKRTKVRVCIKQKYT